jgi:pimeloyl-ACP methyl ester carboxylesterase
MTGMMLRALALPPERKAELAADFRRNNPRVIRRLLREYVRYLGRHAESASRLCDAGVPAWIVHAEKGDGGMTTDERRILEACPLATVVMIPGTSYLLPNEKQAQIAEIIAAAVAAVSPRRL